jgi:hypothetical protein
MISRYPSRYAENRGAEISYRGLTIHTKPPRITQILRDTAIIFAVMRPRPTTSFLKKNPPFFSLIPLSFRPKRGSLSTWVDRFLSRQKGPSPSPGARNQPSGPVNNQPQQDEVTQALANLDDPTGNRLYDGAWGLGNMQPDPKRQAEVAKKLAGLLNSADRRLVNEVTRALAVCATPAEVPVLLQAAANPDFPTRDRCPLPEMTQT